jgi:3-hydroxyisobutyrate dehydrogenase
MKIALIGAGQMGWPMAQHLSKAGHSVTVHYRRDAVRDAAQAAGMAASPSIASAVAAADVVLSSLPNDDALIAVAKEVAGNAPADAVFVDTSTVSLDSSASAAAFCEAQAIPFVRATVSGNSKMAELGQLTVMASGPPEACERVKPLLRLLGPSLFYLGDKEQARLMKLVVNLMIAATAGMLSEALALGEKGGLDWRQGRRPGFEDDDATGRSRLLSRSGHSRQGPSRRGSVGRLSASRHAGLAAP